MALRVLIAGGGIGGLCLAQGLRKNGVDAQVFERDRRASARGQGYRFRVDSDGDAALKACLPANLYALYQATSSAAAKPPEAGYDFRTREIYRMPPPAGAAPPHVSVNRLTLREVLLGGLDGAIHFGHCLRRVEQENGGVRAWFENCAMAEGDVLVAADGIQSVVRRQMLPGAEPVDLGMRCVYGTTPLSPELLEKLPEMFFAGFVPFFGPEDRTLAMGMFRAGRPMAEAALELAPGVRLSPVPNYMMWLYVAPRGAFAAGGELATADGAALQRTVLEHTQGWHATLRSIMEQAEVATLFQLTIRTSMPIGPWPVSRVTWLGDAIHAMTPAGGIGANTAMRDAALLAEALGQAARGERDAGDAIGRYEAEMREYGFAAVRRSLEGAARLYRIPMPEGVA